MCLKKIGDLFYNFSAPFHSQTIIAWIVVWRLAPTERTSVSNFSFRWFSLPRCLLQHANHLCRNATSSNHFCRQCFAPIHHYRNSPSRFSFFTALFSWVFNKNLQHDHCIWICSALMMITGVIETFAIYRLYRFHWPWFRLLGHTAHRFLCTKYWLCFELNDFQLYVVCHFHYLLFTK